MPEVIEAAFSMGTVDDGWWARVTIAHCPICGRRVSEMKTGSGKLAEALPLKIKCRNGHENICVPYGHKRKSLLG